MDRVWSYTFSYLLGAILLGALIWSSGVWNFIANTRLLSVLIDSGVVSYHDAQGGWIRGVPDLKYFLKSQDPIKWGLVEGAAGLFLLFWLIKAAQFHGFCRFAGVSGTFTQHARAYLEGIGLNRFLPFNQGLVRMVSFMETQGSPRDRVTQAVFLGELFVGIEIVVYPAYGPYGLGWSVARADLLGARDPRHLYLLRRPIGLYPEASVFPLSWSEVKESFRALSRRPMEFSKLTVLSLMAFGLEDIAAYMIAMAFTSTHVILNVNFSILLAGDRRELHRRG